MPTVEYHKAGWSRHQMAKACRCGKTAAWEVVVIQIGCRSAPVTRFLCDRHYRALDLE